MPVGSQRVRTRAPENRLRLRGAHQLHPQLPAADCGAQGCPIRLSRLLSLLAQGPPGKDGLNGPPGLPGPKVGTVVGQHELGNPEHRRKDILVVEEF